MSDPTLPRRRSIPLWVKIPYTAFMAVLIPVYWHDWGPQNFLAFCDVALILTLVGLWIESPLVLSMQAVAILLPQSIWIVDVLAHLAGFKFLGMTDYMFNPNYPLFTRLLSLFHGWLPVLLAGLVWRVGYDRRAIWYQTGLGVFLLLVCYVCFVPPGTVGSHRAFNLNYVFGMNESGAQTKYPPLVWLSFLMTGIPILLYLPVHFLLVTLQRRRPTIGFPVVFGDSISTNK